MGPPDDRISHGLVANQLGLVANQLAPTVRGAWRTIQVGVPDLPVGGVRAHEDGVPAQPRQTAFEGVILLPAPVLVMRTADHETIPVQEPGSCVDVEI